MGDLLLLLIGAVVGTIGTLVGAGGGFLLVPAMLFLYPDEAPGVITSTSLAVVFVNAVSGSIAYAAQRRIDYRAALVLAVATVPGSVLGALVASRIDRGPFTVVFSLILIGVAALLVFRPAPEVRVRAPRPGEWRRLLRDRRGELYEYAFDVRLAFVLTLGIGFISSLLGIGGGIIQVPMFILLLGFPTYVATATSQLMLAIMSLAGTATHILTGEFADAARRTALLAPGVVVGAQFGAWLSRRVRPLVISRTLAVAMTLAAGRLLLARLL